MGSCDPFQWKISLLFLYLKILLGVHVYIYKPYAKFWKVNLLSFGTTIFGCTSVIAYVQRGRRCILNTWHKIYPTSSIHTLPNLCKRVVLAPNNSPKQRCYCGKCAVEKVQSNLHMHTSQLHTCTWRKRLSQKVVIHHCIEHSLLTRKCPNFFCTLLSWQMKQRSSSPEKAVVVLLMEVLAKVTQQEVKVHNTFSSQMSLEC